MPTLMTICKEYCGPCPTFQENNLRGAKPHVLFCARCKSEIPTNQIADKGCNCMECPIFTRNDLEGGWFCLYGMEGKK